MNLRTAPQSPTPKLAVVGNTAIKLSRPIQGHNGPIHEVTLRDPTFGDWMECGDFHKTAVHQDDQGNRSMSVVVDPKAVANWFQRLSGIPMSVFMHMEHRDALKVYAALQRIAGDIGEEGNSPTPQAISG